MQKQRNRIEKKRFRGPVRASPPLRGTGRRIFVPLRRVAVCSAVAAATALCSRDGRTTSLRNATLPPCEGENLAHTQGSAPTKKTPTRRQRSKLLALVIPRS